MALSPVADLGVLKMDRCELKLCLICQGIGEGFLVKAPREECAQKVLDVLESFHRLEYGQYESVRARIAEIGAIS